MFVLKKSCGHNLLKKIQITPILCLRQKKLHIKEVLNINDRLFVPKKSSSVILLGHTPKGWHLPVFPLSWTNKNKVVYLFKK
jgi:hypothetical protein